MMVAFHNLHAFAPAALSRRASFTLAHRDLRALSAHLASRAVRATMAAGEIVLFTWMVLAIAFSIGVMLGFLL
jgi:hypothetical protein